MSAFFCKKSAFTQSHSEGCVRDFLVLFSVFVIQKVAINENVSFTDYASGIRLPDCYKLATNWKNSNDITICQNYIIANFF